MKKRKRHSQTCNNANEENGKPQERQQLHVENLLLPRRWFKWSWRWLLPVLFSDRISGVFRLKWEERIQRILEWQSSLQQHPKKCFYNSHSIIYWKQYFLYDKPAFEVNITSLGIGIHENFSSAHKMLKERLKRDF